MNKIYHFLNCFSFILLLFALNTNIQAQNISFTTDTAKLIGIKSFFVDEVSNKIYIAIKGGVAVSTDDGNTYTQKIFDATNQPNLTVNDIYALNNKVYVATNNGLYLSDNSGASFTKTSNGLSLPNNHASCVFVSSGGTLYIGTYAGFSVLPQGKSSFTNYSTKNTTGLGDNHVNSIYVSDGKIYLGTDYGLAISTTNDSSFINYTTANGLINNHVNSVFTSDGTVYTATDDGISVLKNNSTFTNYSKVNGLGANYVNNVYVKGSNIYAATDSGMSVLSNGRTTFSTFSTASGLGHLGDYIVYRSFVSGAKVYAITNGGLSQSLVSVSIATSTGSLDFCLDSKVTFIANPSGGGNVPTFQWKKNDINIGDNSGIYVDSTLRTNDRISCDMTPSGDAANNTVVSSNYLAMRAFPHPSVSLAINTSTGRQCINDVSLAANIVGKYQSLSWFKDSQNIVTKYVTTKNTIDYSTVFPKVITVNVYPDANYKPSSEGTYYAVVKNAIGCPDTSESFEVLPNTKATIAIGVTTGSSKICTGTPVTFSTLTTNAGNIYVAPNTGNSAIYQWKKNGSTVGTNATSYTDNSLHNNDIITCNLQASILLCPDRQSNGSPVVKTSNGITMSVSNPPSLSVGSFGNCTPISY